MGRVVRVGVGVALVVLGMVLVFIGVFWWSWGWFWWSWGWFWWSWRRFCLVVLGEFLGVLELLRLVMRECF